MSCIIHEETKGEESFKENSGMLESAINSVPRLDSVALNLARVESVASTYLTNQNSLMTGHISLSRPTLPTPRITDEERRADFEKKLFRSRYY